MRQKKVGKKSIKKIDLSELKIENQICDYLTLSKITFWKMKVRGELHVSKGRTFIRKNKNAGFPDILCCVNGIFVGFEIKKPGGYQSIEQQLQEQKIKAAGGYYFLVTNFEEIIQYLKELK